MTPMPGGAVLSRRALLFGLGVWALSSSMPARRAVASTRSSDYRVDISMLWGVVRYVVAGSMVEEIDAAAGRYHVLITGTGTGITSRIEAQGLIEPGGRHRPLEMKNAHTLAGRESWLSITYDYGRQLVDYRAVGH